MAKTRENMAIVYEEQGHYDQDLEIFKPVLETKMCVRGQDSPRRGRVVQRPWYRV